MAEQTEQEIPVEIPSQSISEDVLNAIVESYILREGTDYGEVEVSFEQKMTQILHQIKIGKLKIVFESSSETVNLVLNDESSV